MTRIKAYFENMADARKTIAILRDKGISGAHLDMLEGFYEEYSEEISGNGDRELFNLASMAISSGYKASGATNKGRISSASLNTVGSFKVVKAANTSLVVKADEDKMKDVLAIIHENGGTT